MLIITNRKKKMFYFPGRNEEGKWTIFEMTMGKHLVREWKGNRNNIFDTYKECETWMNIICSGRDFGKNMDVSFWCGPDDRARFVLELNDNEVVEPWTKILSD